MNDDELVNIVNIATFYYRRNRQQPHADMEKFYMHTCNCHDEWWPTV